MLKMNKDCIVEKAKGAWKAMTETKMEFQVKASVTPMMLVTMAAACGTALCIMHTARKMEIKIALRKQQKSLMQKAKDMEA